MNRALHVAAVSKRYDVLKTLLAASSAGVNREDQVE